MPHIAPLALGLPLLLWGCAGFESPQPKAAVWVPRSPVASEGEAGFLRPIYAPAHAANRAEHEEEGCPCTMYADFEAWLEREEKVRAWRAANQQVTQGAMP